MDKQTILKGKSEMEEKVRNALVELGKLHTEGVILRNRGKNKKFKVEDQEAWRKEYYDWKPKVVNILVTIHPGMAQRIQTVNHMPEKKNYRFRRAKHVIGKSHQTDLRTLERRLEILEKIMYKEIK